MNRKVAILALSAAVIASMTGCAMTDYTNTPAQSVTLDENHLSHTAIGCAPGRDPFTALSAEFIVDPIARGVTGNTQQELEPLIDDIFDRAITPPALCQSNCSFGSTVVPPCPGAVPGGATSIEAREWERFIGAYAFITEAQVLFPGSPQFQGHWAMGGVKALDTDCNADGMRDVRIHTWYRPITVFGPFSCPTGQSSGFQDGTLGGPETSLLGDGLDGRLPEFRPETVAIDTRPGAQFGINIYALDPDRNDPITGGYSTFLGVLGRTAEGKNNHAEMQKGDLLPSAGLTDFFAGQPLTVRIPGYDGTVTATGSVLPDGFIELAIVGVSWGQSQLELSAPLTIQVSRKSGNLVRFDATGQEQQLRELARWALATVPLDEHFSIGGFVPELGVTLRSVEVQLSAKAIGSFLSRNADLSGRLSGTRREGGER